MVGYDLSEKLTGKILKLNENEKTYATIIEEDNTQIDSHYKKIDTFYNQLRIYDCECLTNIFFADIINIYTAENHECIIGLINKKYTIFNDNFTFKYEFEN